MAVFWQRRRTNERYKHYRHPFASARSFLYAWSSPESSRAVTIINRRPAVTYSMRFMKRLTVRATTGSWRCDLSCAKFLLVSVQLLFVAT